MQTSAYVRMLSTRWWWSIPVHVYTDSLDLFMRALNNVYYLIAIIWYLHTSRTQFERLAGGWDLGVFLFGVQHTQRCAERKVDIYIDSVRAFPGHSFIQEACEEEWMKHLVEPAVDKVLRGCILGPFLKESKAFACASLVRRPHGIHDLPMGCVHIFHMHACSVSVRLVMYACM